MADKDITAAIDKLRKTRPTRAIETLWNSAGDPFSGDADALIAVLTMLRDDLKEECRLVELAKIRGGTSIVKDRAAVASWLELFVHQLGEPSAPVAVTDAPAWVVSSTDGRPVAPSAADQLRDLFPVDPPEFPSERLSPSPELGEHRPSDRGTDAAILPGPGGRCAAGNVHDEHTLKCGCGFIVVDSSDMNQAPSVEDYLSGTVDSMTFLGPLPDDGIRQQQREARELREPWDPDGLTDSLADVPFTALDTVPGEQAAHTAIDKEYAHVHADPVADPFAPIPRVNFGALTMPPGGRKWTTADLLKPIAAALLPPHLSFSQITTVTDCGAKYRMQRIERLPQVPQWANIGGRAFHAAIELLESGKNGGPEALWNHEFEREINETEKASGMVRESFRASQQGRESFDWWRVEGAAMLQRYASWRTGDGAGQQVLRGPGGVPMLEWETTYLVDGVPFKTVLDSVWLDPRIPGTAIIRDWKTGSGTPDDRQLCTQACGLRIAFGEYPVLAQFFDARKGVFTEPFDPFERMSWDDVRYFVLGADAQRRLPILPARPSDFCGGCSVAYACPVMSQRRIKK